MAPLLESVMWGGGGGGGVLFVGGGGFDTGVGN
jgi:hypothetical protein